MAVEIPIIKKVWQKNKSHTGEKLTIADFDWILFEGEEKRVRSLRATTKELESERKPMICKRFAISLI